jgi:EmrB/QacA subfamily drug resistance transporter
MKQGPRPLISRPVQRAESVEGLPGLGKPTGLSPVGFALVLAASFIVVLDFSIVNLALASIEKELGFSATSLQWVVTAYAITFGGLLILGGALADRLGLRRMFVAGLLVFTVASLAGGVAGSPELLVAARAVQGIGAAIVAPAALAMITSGFQEGAVRNRALGLFGATASVGFVGGLVLGGLLVQLLGWRSVFFVNVPVGLLAGVLSLRYLPNSGTRTSTGSLDVGGGLLITVSIASLVFAVSEIPVIGFGSADVIASLILFLSALAGFVLVELHHPHPLVRFGILKLRSLRTANSITALLGVWNGGEMIVMTLYFQLGLHYSPLLTGLAMAPQGLVSLLTGLRGAPLAARLGLRRLLTLTTATATLGFLILSQNSAPGAYPIILVAVSLIGFGTAGTMFAGTVGASAGVGNAEQGLAGGLVNMSRQIGAAIGAAVLLAVAEGGTHRVGLATSIPGDREAMFVAALVALAAAALAWRGIAKPVIGTAQPHPSVRMVRDCPPPAGARPSHGRPRLRTSPSLSLGRPGPRTSSGLARSRLRTSAGNSRRSRAMRTASTRRTATSRPSMSAIRR